jgi:hypothetical protein
MKTLIILIFTFLSFSALAQDSLQTLNFNRNRIKNTGMEVLGSWAAANLVVGGIGWASTGGTTKYFHQMNAVWNVANLGVAIAGYASAQNDRNKHYTAEESLKAQHQIEKIFLVNGGLDLVYIGTGFYLKHRGDIKNSDQLRGYGPAIILQGGFLLLFDAIMYTSEKNNGNKIGRFLLQHPVTFDGQKVGMVLNL